MLSMDSRCGMRVRMMKALLAAVLLTGCGAQTSAADAGDAGPTAGVPCERPGTWSCTADGGQSLVCEDAGWTVRADCAAAGLAACRPTGPYTECGRVADAGCLEFSDGGVFGCALGARCFDQQQGGVGKITTVCTAPDGTGISCSDDLDCPDSRYFFCSPSLRCQARCLAQADCVGANRGRWAISWCSTETCSCSAQKCVRPDGGM